MRKISLLVVLLTLFISACTSTVEFKISFDSNGGSFVEPIVTDGVSSITTPKDPVKEGFTFAGWYLSNDYTGNAISAIDFKTKEQITLYAKWEINSYTISYTIFDRDYNSYNSITLNEDESITQVSLGSDHSLLLTSRGKVFAWGHNFYGQLGDGTRIDKVNPVDITAGFNLSSGELITQLSSGNEYSSAITSRGRLYIWGINNVNQLGDGTTINSNTPIDITSRFNLNLGETVIQVTLGYGQTVALTSRNRIFTWGNNDSGQLGDGTLTTKAIPTDITSRFNLSSNETFSSVSLGWKHSAVLTSSGRLFTWGSNFYGQLGDGTTTDRYTPTEINSVFNLNSGETITQISLGFNNSSALTSSGRLYTWGRNAFGQLGDSTSVDRTLPTNINSQFNLNSGEIITQIILSPDHSSALTSKGRLFTWGQNMYGQLGNGKTSGRYTPTEITSHLNLVLEERVSQVSLGWQHSSALTSKGRLFTWGYNFNGQLGDGTTINRNIPIRLDNNTLYSNESIVYIFNETLSENTPLREGYTFDGWYIDRELTQAYTFSTMPGEDLILYGKWILIED
jgi:uncharacterized repeat protein (TIGR02543 family)